MNFSTNISVGESTCESALADQVIPYLPNWDKKNSKDSSVVVNNNDDDDDNFYFWKNRHTNASRRNVTLIPPLTSLCTDILARHFATHPLNLETVLPPCLAKTTVSKMASDIDHCITARFLRDENYWKRVCVETYGMDKCDIGMHGLTWKRLFFERYLKEMIETSSSSSSSGRSSDDSSNGNKKEGLRSGHDGDDVQRFLSMIKLFQDHIFTLQLRHIPDHISISDICSVLPNLSKIDIQYYSAAPSNKNNTTEDMNYDQLLFGMKPHHVTDLAKVLQMASPPLDLSTSKTCGGCRNLQSLILKNNQINDDLTRCLVDGISETIVPSLTHLDVSHNKITTNGLRLLANKFLSSPSSSSETNPDETTTTTIPPPILTSLNLSDNRIHAEGGRCLGRLLRTNKSLTYLNLRLNKLGDEGGRMIFEGLRENDVLTHLDVSSNRLGRDCAVAFGGVFVGSGGRGGVVRSVLRVVNLASNCMGDCCDLERVLDGVVQSETLVCLDLRGNGSSHGEQQLQQEGMKKDLMDKIDAVLKKNELKLKSPVC